MSQPKAVETSREAWRDLPTGSWFFHDSPNCTDRYSVQERTNAGCVVVCATSWHHEKAVRDLKEIAELHNARQDSLNPDVKGAFEKIAGECNCNLARTSSGRYAEDQVEFFWKFFQYGWQAHHGPQPIPTRKSGESLPTCLHGIPFIYSCPKCRKEYGSGNKRMAAKRRTPEAIPPDKQKESTCNSLEDHTDACATVDVAECGMPTSDNSALSKHCNLCHGSEILRGEIRAELEASLTPSAILNRAINEELADLRNTEEREFIRQQYLRVPIELYLGIGQGCGMPDEEGE